MTMLPFSLLDFSNFRFCVIKQVSALKLLSLISVTCPKDTRKAHTVPYNELCHHLWDSLAPSVHTLLCNPAGPGQFCALPSECLALWQVSSWTCLYATHQLQWACLVPRTVLVNICPATVESHAPYLCLFSWYYTYSIHLHQLVQHTSHTKIRTHFILLSLPWFRKTIRLQSDVLMLSTTYLCYPLTAVQWHNLHGPITCLNLQSHDTISCQTCCYLIFLNFLVYLSEVENSKYGTRNTPTTGSTNGMKMCHSFWTIIMPLV